MKDKTFAWLVVNGFLNHQKFSDIYRLLTEAADRAGITLITKKNTELVSAGDFRADRAPRFVLFWDKDLPLAARLERTGLRLMNSRRTIELCDDKIKTAAAAAGLPMPITVAAPFTYENVGYTNTEFLISVEETLSYPFVIKPAKGSFGEGVALVRSREEAAAFVRRLRAPFLCQQFVPHEYDLRVNVVGGRVVSCIKRINSGDFRSNVTLGGRAEEHTPTAAEAELAVLACRAVGADFAGVDIFAGERPQLCEINSNPHFRSTLDCTGKNMADEIMKYAGGII